MTSKKLKYNLILGTLKAVALLPLSVLYAISTFIYWIVYHVIRYRVKVVRSNLAKAFPEKGEQERRSIEKAFFHHLADTIVETIKLLHISDKELDRRVTVEGGELVDRLADEGHPIILFLGHYGNWEWTPAMIHHFSRPTVLGQIYRPLKNLAMEEVMLTIRGRFPTVCIPQKRAFRQLLEYVRNGEKPIIGFIADQRPNSSNLYHWTTFLNQETTYVTGGEEIGKRINAAYVFLDVSKPSRGHYHLEFKQVVPLGNSDARYPVSLTYMRMMEQTIRRAPEFWLWSHKRWSVSRPDDIELDN